MTVLESFYLSFEGTYVEYIVKISIANGSDKNRADQSSIKKLLEMSK